MKLWLDDIRNPEFWITGDYREWTWAKTAAEAMEHINTGKVTEVSLDHDLGDEVDSDGDELNGYAVACHIEYMAYTNQCRKIKWNIHSANPVGRHNMEIALKQADKYWRDHESKKD